MLAERKEVTLTAAQKALLRVQKIQARGNFLIANLLLLLLVGYTVLRFPQKYVRVLGEYVRRLFYGLVALSSFPPDA